MNTEYALDTLKTNLETYLTTELTTIQHEANSSVVAPSPGEYKFGVHDPNILTLFPSISIYSPYSRKRTDKSGFQVREIWIRVLTYVVANDLEDLHRYVVRYSDGIAKVFRNESYWEAKSFHNPVVEDSNNTDLYERDIGYAQGTLLEGTIDYLLV